MSERRRVLAVDDEHMIAYLVKATLEDAGYQVRTARDGLEALEALAEESFDLLITDIMMPHLDGWELCKKLHSDEQLAKIPVVVMSAARDLREPDGCRTAAKLPKPFDIDALVRVVRQLLE